MADDVFDEDFTEQIVNVSWPGGATEFNSGAYMVAPPTAKSLRFTISFFLFLPAEFGGSVDNVMSIVDFGLADPAKQVATSGLTFQGDGTGKVGIFTGYHSLAVKDESDDALAEYQITEFGSVTTTGTPVGTGVFTAGEWHHIFTAGDMSAVIAQSWPSDGEGLRPQDLFFTCLNPLYVDRRNVGIGDDPQLACGAQRTPLRAVVAPQQPGDLEITDADFDKVYTAFPDVDPPFQHPVHVSFSGISFSGDFGVPTLGEPGATLGTGTSPRLAGVQIWPAQYISPSPSNLDKFVKIGDNGEVQMVDPAVAAKAFGQPVYSFNGPPKKFVTNLGTGGDPGVFGQIGSTIKQVKGPPKAQ